MKEVTFEIVEQIGVIEHNENHWNKELNIVKWNDREPRFDIRDWNADHTQMSRGITLTAEQFLNLMKIVNDKKGERVMGNRAVITTKKEWDNVGIGIYLHWNGGRDSVEAFLTYCRMKDYRSPVNDNYGWARLCQVIGNFFGGELSVGVDKLNRLDLDNGDNGVYFIGGESGWEIEGRYYFDGEEQYMYDLEEMINQIDDRMPTGEQLGKEVIRQKISEIKAKSDADI